MSELRWVWKLVCGHALLADDAPGPTDTHEYCRECQFTTRIEDSYRYLDEDVFARFESDGAPHPDEDPAREHANAHLDDLDAATGEGRR